jgi:hypothetical protein
MTEAFDAASYRLFEATGLSSPEGSINEWIGCCPAIATTTGCSGLNPHLERPGRKV